MSLETVVLDHLPSSFAIHLALFKNVRNADFLHKQLLARNTDFQYAFVDASVVVSRLQLLSAVFKAVSNAVNDVLKTPNVHSETVTSLSASSNIADAYRRYGISPSTTDLLVVKIIENASLSADEIWAHLVANVKGEALPVTDGNISAVTDLTKVRKYYKLNGLNWLDNIKDDVERRKELEMLVVEGMAVRGV